MAPLPASPALIPTARASARPLVVAALIGMAMLTTGCGAGSSAASTPGAASGKPAAPAVPVVTAAVTHRDVAIQINAVGTVKASAVVAVRSQITGTLLTVGFTEGADVVAGQTLFTIDTRALEQSLKQAEANRQRSVSAQRQAEADLVRDQAQSTHAEKDWQRLSGLPSGIATHDEIESARAAADADNATVTADRAAIDTAISAIAADQAAVDYARVQMGYGTITAPCAGRVGALLVNAGNLVTANADVLVTINALRPVRVTYAVPESFLTDLRSFTASGAVAVTAIPGGDQQRARKGTIDLIDNQVDPTTGTINVRATFPNTDTALWPGEYVNVVVNLTTRPNQLVVPAQALQVGQKGQYVYVIGDDHKATITAVTTGPTVDGITVIDSGLDAGQTVVIDGQMKLTAGTLTAEVPPVGSATASATASAPVTPGDKSAPVAAGSPR